MKRDTRQLLGALSGLFGAAIVILGLAALFYGSVIYFVVRVARWAWYSA